jgi:hypothetical protein
VPHGSRLQSLASTKGNRAGWCAPRLDCYWNCRIIFRRTCSRVPRPYGLQRTRPCFLPAIVVTVVYSAWPASSGRRFRRVEACLPDRRACPSAAGLRRVMIDAKNGRRH